MDRHASERYFTIVIFGDLPDLFTSQREIIKTLKVTNIDFYTQKSSLLTERRIFYSIQPRHRHGYPLRFPRDTRNTQADTETAPGCTECDPREQVWGISENHDRKLSLECVTMNSPCKGKSLQTTVYWVDQ